MQKLLAPANKNTVPAEIVVGANECRLARQGERLVARGISADVVVTLQAPSSGFAAMLRFSAPDEPNVSRNRLDALWNFADEALALLFESLRSMDIPVEDVAVSAIGGADVADCADGLGKEMALGIRRILWSHGVVLHGNDLGGSQSRIVWLESSSGRLIVRSCLKRPSEAAARSRRPWLRSQAITQ